MLKYKRKKKLINPVLQLRLSAVFAMAALAGVLAQFILLNIVLADLGREFPAYAELLQKHWPSLLWKTVWITIGLVLPFTLGLGILVTFRLAGPLYRFETYMGQVARGEDPGPCRIRKGDMLQSTCDVINTLCAPIRARNASASSNEQQAQITEVPSLVASQEETPRTSKPHSGASSR
jgi:hypothetical protein